MIKQFIENLAPLLILGSALASCAQTEWQRPGTDAAVAAGDLRACSQQAALSARRLASVDSRHQPRLIRTPGAHPSVAMPASPADRDPLLERDFLGQCLRDKGYTQVEKR